MAIRTTGIAGLLRHLLWIGVAVSAVDCLPAQMGPPLKGPAQEYQMGVALGVPGMSMRYPMWTAGIWHSTGANSWMSFTAGFSARGQVIKRASTDALFRESVRRNGFALQYMHTRRRGEVVEPFLTAGLYYMKVRAEVGRSYIYNLPPGEMTVHDGAQFSAVRAGLLPGIGIRFHTFPVYFESQLTVPVYYESPSYAHLQNPLRVVDFVPDRINPYQRGNARFAGGLILSISAGIAW